MLIVGCTVEPLSPFRPVEAAAGPEGGFEKFGNQSAVLLKLVNTLLGRNLEKNQWLCQRSGRNTVKGLLTLVKVLWLVTSAICRTIGS